jgi:hypothetical protein
MSGVHQVLLIRPPPKNSAGASKILLLRHLRKYNVGMTMEKDYHMYTGTKSDNPPPPSIRMDEEDYHLTYTGTKSGNPPRSSITHK